MIPISPNIPRTDEHEQPVSPVRDDSALGPTEDLDRKPGGFPHRVMAATALFAIVTVGLVFVALVASSTAALVLVAILVVLVIVALRREATRRRDHVHPSR